MMDLHKKKILEKADTEKFLSEAPRNIYLMMKVATIFSIAGACHGSIDLWVGRSVGLFSR